MNHSSLPLLRILDANANRAAEGLRVVEDFVRFVLNDRHLSRLCKQLRHDLAAAVALLPAAALAASRDTPRDVGTTVATDAEYLRADARAVARASGKRVEQALRCLEEYGKVLLGQAASRFEQLRYRAYTLHRAIDVLQASLERLDSARLYVLIDGGESPAAFDRQVSELLAARVDVLQLRDKRLADRELLGRARQLRELTRDTPTLFVMNDRPDLAAIAEADGVHVGQEELSVHEARLVLGPGKLVGVSTHSIEQARAAVLDGADYLGCGPTFPSSTKSFAEFPGLDFLRQVAAEIQLPAFAIGGITYENVPLVLETGLRRIAVRGGIVDADAPGKAARELRRRLEREERQTSETRTTEAAESTEN